MNYPLFDNAKSVDIASMLFNFEASDYRRYRDSIRFQFYNEVGYTGINGLISNFCYSGPENLLYLESVAKLLEHSGFLTSFVYLRVSKYELLRRACQPSRKKKNTLRSNKEIEQWLQQNPSYDLVTDEFLIVENSKGKSISV